MSVIALGHWTNKANAEMESQRRVFKFGPFGLDTGERVLSRNGSRIRLQGQPYQILEILLGRPGKVVTRDEIRETLWPGDTYVDFKHGRNTSVKKLRLTLGDSAERPSYVRLNPQSTAWYQNLANNDLALQ